MSGLVFTNFAKSKIASAPDGTTGTSFSVTAGDGALFPNPGTGEYFYGVFKDSDGNHEVVKVTARSTDSMTITRAQDNTTAQTWSVGDYFLLGPTAAMMKDLLTEAETYADAVLPKSTSMLFAQASAPTGWTKDTTTYNHALRLTSGDGGGTGGTDDFTTTFAITATDTHALTQAEMPSHTHTISVSNPSHTHTATDAGHTHSLSLQPVTNNNAATHTSLTSSGTGYSPNTTTALTGHASITVAAATTAVTATAASVGSGTAHSHNISLKVKYYDLIRCTRDS